MESLISNAVVDNNQVVGFFSHIMDSNDIRITKTEVRKRLVEFDVLRNSYEDTQRLDNISKLFFFWGIDNLHISTKFSDRIDENWPSSFICYSSIYGFIYVKYFDDNLVEFYCSSLSEDVKIDFIEIKESLLNQVIFVEAQEHSGQLQIDIDSDNEKDRNKRTLLHLSLAAILVFLAAPCYFAFYKGLIPFLLVITKLVGLSIFSILLLRQFSTERFKDIDKVCSSVSSRFNCGEILDSPGAKILGGLNLSELGMIYFLSSLINLTIATTIGNEHIIVLLSLTSFMTMLLVMYSLFYQAFVVKKWCLYCLLVDMLIIVEVVLFYYQFDYLNPSFEAIVLYLFICTTPFFIVALFKYLTEEIKEYTPGSSKGKYFIYNPIVFDKLLKNEPIIELTDAPIEMFFGSKNQSNKTIVFVISVKCLYCAKAIYNVKNIVELFPDYQIVIRLSIGEDSTSEELRISKIVFNAMALDVEIAKGALIDWTEVVSQNMKLKEWEEKYNNYKLTDSELKISESLFDFHRDWSSQTNLNYTPAFIIDGHRMPKIYSLSNIKLHLAWVEGKLG